MTVHEDIDLATVFRYSVKTFQSLVEAGVFKTSRRGELLEGLLREQFPASPPNDYSASRLDDLLRPLLPAGFLYRANGSIVTKDSVPVPDRAVVRREPGLFLTRHPRADETAVVIEVADDTLELDRELKGRVYARAGIPAHWIVNTRDGVPDVYTNPVAGRNPHYRRMTPFRHGESISLALGDAVLTLAVSDLLPPPDTRNDA